MAGRDEIRRKSFRGGTVAESVKVNLKWSFFMNLEDTLSEILQEIKKLQTLVRNINSASGTTYQ